MEYSSSPNFKRKENIYNKNVLLVYPLFYYLISNYRELDIKLVVEKLYSGNKKPYTFHYKWTCIIDMHKNKTIGTLDLLKQKHPIKLSL